MAGTSRRGQAPPGRTPGPRGERGGAARGGAEAEEDISNPPGSAQKPLPEGAQRWVEGGGSAPPMTHELTPWACGRTSPPPAARPEG